MNKFVALALLAVSPLLAVAAPSQDVISESMSDGASMRTRSLDAQGVLTESVCLTGVEGDRTLQHCVSQRTQLSKARARDIASQMSMAQSVLVHNSVFRGRSDSKSDSETRGGQSSMQMGASVARSTSANFESLASASRSTSVSAKASE
jgi:hypothetical protein